jgi:hypothetical protein
MIQPLEPVKFVEQGSTVMMIRNTMKLFTLLGCLNLQAAHAADSENLLSSPAKNPEEQFKEMAQLFAAAANPTPESMVGHWKNVGILGPKVMTWKPGQTEWVTKDPFWISIDDKDVSMEIHGPYISLASSFGSYLLSDFKAINQSYERMVAVRSYNQNTLLVEVSQLAQAWEKDEITNLGYHGAYYKFDKILSESTPCKMKANIFWKEGGRETSPWQFSLTALVQSEPSVISPDYCVKAYMILTRKS